MFRFLSLFVALALMQVTVGTQTPGRRVAVTIDDGPVVSELMDPANFQRITDGLVGAFQAEQVPVTIFVNERQINVPGQRDRRAAALEQWVDAGFDLGNHTYEHLSLNRTTLQEYQDQILKGEVISRAIMEARGRAFTWFRYPFLNSGTTADVHQGVMDFLAARGYRVAPVTVDYSDYTFSSAYVRELRRANADVAEKIKQAYIAHVDAGFDYAERASKELYGREIPQILLIHCNELNSVTLRETLGRMRARGYAFVTLDEAMADEAYQRPDTFAGSGGSWLSRSATVMGKRLTTERQARVPQWIVDAAPPIYPTTTVAPGTTGTPAPGN